MVEQKVLPLLLCVIALQHVNGLPQSRPGQEEKLLAVQKLADGDFVQSIEGDWLSSSDVTQPVVAGGNPQFSQPVCRASHDGEVIPGWEDFENKICNFGSNGRGFKSGTYENLESERPDTSVYIYVPGNECKFPVVGGHAADKELYYICSAISQAEEGESPQEVSHIPGKFRKSSNSCDVEVDGKETKSTDFNLLCLFKADNKN